MPQDESLEGLDYHALNAMLNLYGPNGEIQFGKDVAAATFMIRAMKPSSPLWKTEAA